MSCIQFSICKSFLPSCGKLVSLITFGMEPHQKLFKNWTVLHLLDPLSILTDALQGLWRVGKAGFLSAEATLPGSQQTMFIPVYSDFTFLDPTAISKDGWQTSWSAIPKIPSKVLFVAGSCNGSLPALWQPGACHAGLLSPSHAARG